MALTETRPEQAVIDPTAERPPQTAIERVLGSGDHKTIGRVFIGASLLFLAVDLVVAALSNLDTATGDLFDAGLAVRFGLNHPLSLLFGGALPLLLGLAIYVVPLQVGSPTVAFPRAAAMSLWGWLFGVVLFSVAFAADGAYGGSDLDLARLGHVSVGLMAVALLVGTMCVMVTVVSHRVAGMTLSRVPFFAYSMLVAGTVWMLTLPALLANLTIWHIRHPGTADLAGEGYASFGWIFHQPASFMIAIPVLGILADVASAASGSRQGMYGSIQAMIGFFGLLSFGAWAQVEASRETLVWAISGVLFAVPVLAVLGGSVDTLRRGKVAVSGGLIAAFASAMLLLLASLTAAVAALNTATSTSLFALDAGSFAETTPGLSVGQFYLLIAVAATGGLAGLFHWGDRIVAGGLPGGAGKAIAPIALVGGGLFGIGQVVIGIAGPDESGVKLLGTVSAVGAVLLGLAALVAFAAFVGARLGGRDAAEDDDPGELGGTLEWATASPPPAGNFETVPGPVESAYPLFDEREKGAR